MYREIAHRKIEFDEPRLMVELSKVAETIAGYLPDTEAFESLETYTEKDYHSPYVMDLAFDFDHETDLAKTFTDAQKLYQYLWKNQIIATPYFSGGKGFHIVIPCACIGLPPREDTVDQYRAVATGFKTTLKLETMDLSIYGQRRIFRSVGSPNLKNKKLFKTRLTVEQMMDGTLEDIFEASSKCKPDRGYEYEDLVPGLADKILAAKIVEPKPEKLKSKKIKQEAHDIPITDVLDKLGVYYEKDVVFEDGKSTSMKICFEGNYINRFSEKPPRGDTYEMVMYFNKCSFPEAKRWMREQFGISDVGAVKVDSIDDIKQQAKAYYGTETLDWSVGEHAFVKLPLLKKTQFGLVVGTYNSGKTEFTYSVALNNAKQGSKVVYLSLEMTGASLIERRARAVLGYTSTEVDQDNDKLDRVIEGMDAQTHENLDIIEAPDNVGRGASREWVEQIVKQRKPDLLIVDNFNRIGGGGSDQDKYNEQALLAQFLKDFAEKKNCCIIGVHHIGKASQKEVRPPEQLTMADAEGTGQLANIALWALIVGRYKKFSGEGTPDKEDLARFCIKVDRDRFDGFQGYGHWYFYKGEFLSHEDYQDRQSMWHNE